MVYPGHPSRGCDTCRARKVKCDEAKPECLRCAKAKRPCLGYRMLDDGTRKALAIRKTSENLKPSMPTLDFALFKSGDQNNVPNCVAPGACVTPLLDSLSSFPRLSLNQVNLHRLFSHVARLPQIDGVYDGCLTCLPSVCETLPPSSPLYSALSALLLAFVSQGNDDTRTMGDASENYGQALKLTRLVIRQRDARRKKEVILTTLILSMYEDLANPQHIDPLNPHFRGAMALMKDESVENNNDITTKRLYGAFVTRLMYTSQRNTFHNSDDSFPLAVSELRKLYDAAPTAKGPVVPRRLLHPATCKLLEAQLLLRKVEDSNITGETVSMLKRVIKSIHEVEKDVSRWPQMIPADHAPETVQLSPEAVDPWSSTALVYNSYPAANAWAHYRAVRIFANDLLLWAYNLITPAVFNDSISLSLTELSMRIEAAHVQILSSASEICASMSYHLGYSVRGSDELRYPKEGFPDGRHPRKMSACNVTWPLYTAGIVDGLKPTQKLWVARRLDFLSTQMGVKQASTLAMAVRSRVYQSNEMESLLESGGMDDKHGEVMIQPGLDEWM